MRLSFLPEIAVPQNLFDNHFFLDKRNYPHIATAFRTFQRINLIDAFDQCDPSQLAFPQECGIRFGFQGNTRQHRGQFQAILDLLNQERQKKKRGRCHQCAIILCGHTDTSCRPTIKINAENLSVSGCFGGYARL
jgi:hypothetical protein